MTQVESPENNVSRADKKRDDAEAPRAAFPIVAGAKEDHDADAPEHPLDAATKIGALSNDRRRIEQRLGHGLTFFHHQAYGFVHGAVPREAEVENDRHDQDRHSEDGEEDDENDRQRPVA